MGVRSLIHAFCLLFLLLGSGVASAKAANEQLIKAAHATSLSAIDASLSQGAEINARDSRQQNASEVALKLPAKSVAVAVML